MNRNHARQALNDKIHVTFIHLRLYPQFKYMTFIYS